MVKPVTTHFTQKSLSWYGHVMRREDTTFQRNHKREETSMKAQTEVDELSAERFETRQARSKARTEPRRTEKGNHGDRPRAVIRLSKVR